MGKFVKGINDLETWCKENNKNDILEEWDYEKNTLLPDEITYGSGTLAWWKCSLGHSYKCRINTKTNQLSGCPVCSGYIVQEGFNDLLSQRPDLANEWDYTKNNFTPEEILYTSTQKAWWVCPKGHSYSAMIGNRVLHNSGCPFCNNKKLLIGYNDLSTAAPELADEWNYEKNDVKPNEVIYGTNKKYWWKCNFGHEWEATVSHRRMGTGCPICKAEKHSSFPEQAVFYYIKQAFPDAINGDRHLGMELDIYIPSISFAIEYDGENFHNDINRDLRKDKLCLDEGIRLIHIRESKCPAVKFVGRQYVYKWNDIETLSTIINDVLRQLGINNIIANIKKDRQQIMSQYVKSKKENSLSVVFPSIAAEWHPIKNGTVTPEFVSKASNKIFWWLCKNGHEFEASVNARTGTKNKKCPYCSKK